MSIIQDSHLSIGTPAVPSHGADTRATVNHQWVTAALEGITLTRHYVTRVVQDVIKPAITTFLETCDTNPRIAVLVATPALLGFVLVLAFFIISTLVLVIWTVLTITLGIIFVIIGGFMSLFFKMLVVMLATIPLAGIATALLVGANKVSQSIIGRMPQNGVRPAIITRSIGEVDWKSVMDHLVNLGGKLGSGSAVVWEGLSALRVALHNVLVAFESGIEDLRNARMESVREDRSDSPPNDSMAETSGEPSQGSSNSVHQKQFVPQEHVELRELQPTESIEGLKRRSPFPRTSEDTADTTSA